MAIPASAIPTKLVAVRLEEVYVPPTSVIKDLSKGLGVLQLNPLTQRPRLLGSLATVRPLAVSNGSIVSVPFIVAFTPPHVRVVPLMIVTGKQYL